jgi:hypothetical protein
VYEKHETGKRVPFAKSSMNREDVEKLGLGKPESVNIATNKPMNIPVTGLPEHLHARIMGAYQYELKRDGDLFEYRQNHSSPTPEAALQALKSLLNWDPA